MILVDTTPLVALCDARDSLHEAASKDLAELLPHGLGVCEAVLVETCFHLPYPSQRARLRAMIEDLDLQSIPTHDFDFWTQVFDWLAEYADHEPDWADGCLAVLCGRHERMSVWTYDREFQTTWRTPGGHAIPLAVGS